MGKKTPSIDKIIKKAVDAGLEAGRLSAERSSRNAFKDTERRLYALPTLRQKLEDDRERLEEIKTYGPRSRSKSITRFGKSSVRLTPEETLGASEEDADAIHCDTTTVWRNRKRLVQRLSVWLYGAKAVS